MDSDLSHALKTIGFVTTRWAHLSCELLQKVSNRIINENGGVLRISWLEGAKCGANACDKRHSRNFGEDGGIQSCKRHNAEETFTVS